MREKAWWLKVLTCLSLISRIHIVEDDILFVFFPYVCLCVCVCTHVRVWAHLPCTRICMLSCVQDVCACVHGGLRMMLGDLLDFSSTSVTMVGSLRQTEGSPTQPVNLASSLQCSRLCFPWF